MNEEQFEFMICGWQSSSQGWIMLRQSQCLISPPVPEEKGKRGGCLVELMREFWTL